MPGAWEILQIRANSVAIGQISLSDARVTKNWAKALINLQRPQGGAILDTRGLPYAPARNNVLKRFLEEGPWGWLFFLDDDVILPPDALMKLLASGRDYIAGMYYQRFAPFAPAHGVAQHNAEGKVQKGPLPPYTPGEIIPADLIATGATLMSRRCVEAMAKRYPRPFEWGFDIAPVPTEGGGFLEAISEDYLFSTRANALGFRSYIHTGVQGRHEFRAVATMQGAEMA